ncbi:hypothetical protein SAMN02746062_02346 [Alysiella filiformis DSM 16848]|uniref:Uncharacterized protein n=1 Tax=Alysiella filiformis DSM 16848 TaxID=1120981 RepID=A0A286EWH3_9NEIS|nr:hypothetical protein SAMN02746062_02346 [Alysiella filiformis DSM 16848]
MAGNTTNFRLPETYPLPRWRGRVRVGVAPWVSNPHPSPPPCIGGGGKWLATPQISGYLKLIPSHAGGGGLGWGWLVEFLTPTPALPLHRGRG